jgi:hypothetical protein
LNCVGLPNDSDALEALLRRIEPALTTVGRKGALQVDRWEDPSGARLILRRRGGEIVSFVPSYAGMPGAWIGNATRLAEEVWRVDVLDEAGEQQTAATVDFEDDGLGVSGTRRMAATIIALGNQVGTYPDETAFAQSDDSLLDPSGAPSEPPALFAANNWPWPPRMGAESFISHGVFGPPHEASATARLNGVVLRADRRTNEATGMDFSVARIRTAGMEVDLCLARDEHPEAPGPGQVVGGVVYLVASVDASAGPGRGSFLDRLRSRIS